MLILIWLLGAVVVGAFARSKDRSFVGYTALAMLLSPIVGFIAVLVLGSSGRKCPACAEIVKQDALKCKFCGALLPPVADPVSAEV